MKTKTPPRKSKPVAESTTQETNTMVNFERPTVQTETVHPATIIPPANIPTPEQEKSLKAAETSVKTIEQLAVSLNDFKQLPNIPPIAEVKAKRGRKPGSKNEPKPPVENFQPKVEQPVFVGAVISGAILLAIVDAFVPWVISWLHNVMNKHNPITAKELKLPDDIKNDLKSAADEAIKTSNLKLTPAQVLGLSMLAAYGTAYAAAVTKPKPKKV
jgi:hypothetical protein